MSCIRMKEENAPCVCSGEKEEKIDMAMCSITLNEETVIRSPMIAGTKILIYDLEGNITFELFSNSFFTGLVRDYIWDMDL
jgi:hypothetical protein